jgi:hypothetical protein
MYQTLLTTCQTSSPVEVFECQYMPRFWDTDFGTPILGHRFWDTDFGTRILRKYNGHLQDAGYAQICAGIDSGVTGLLWEGTVV